MDWLSSNFVRMDFFSKTIELMEPEEREKPSNITANQEVSFQGHVISRGGIVVDPAKVDKVLEWKTPKLVTKIRSFLGLVGCYRRFIEGFSKLALPLTKLTQKGELFMWDTHCENNFQELKKRLTSTPILVLPNPSELFVVYCDTCGSRLGGVLMQD
ncbi:uncharacterized mitochondrial protein AtMg00860-like [Cicer arietinum]|uniref:uncharacterized mitochondrial protein AtMg00860-like n=1 Tax=Cicer arietinum TaxID=3827 RepID=UPI003CC6D592